MAAHKLPSILKIAILIDWPLLFPLLNNREINNPDIIKFCPNAAYFPSISLNSIDIAMIIRKLQTSAMRNEA